MGFAVSPWALLSQPAAASNACREPAGRGSHESVADTQYIWRPFGLISHRFVRLHGLNGRTEMRSIGSGWPSLSCRYVRAVTSLISSVTRSSNELVSLYQEAMTR